MPETGWAIRRRRNGRFDVLLSGRERDVLRGLPAQLRSLMEGDDGEPDPARERLFPPAFLDDPDREREYRSMMRDDLLDERRRAVDAMERTLGAKRLTEEEVLAWLSVVNDLRLVLGVRLAVTEDTDPSALPDDDPHRPAYALYGYLSWLEEGIVRALSPEAGRAGEEPLEDGSEPG